ncbi:tol-pal system protein YbgF [Endozoicomonas sp. 8E]|uniref:tol-pal system protein YbgF n=1 Tax=Endozoicomonas sp. 8E TaxID=3035692 RepID=UPI002938E41A|nr:tol-pal system protein YbgF [Endozoicomonas sp. 8E]WOG26105.1 tol-pal system protein YbgF [Endozoicomonas sp. 8E]
MPLKRSVCSAFVVAGLASYVQAEVPVVDSQPSGNAYSVESSQAREPAPMESSVGGTAHVLNLMDELRQEIMTLRGQLEEQAYQIKQLQKENRDRYLDLDQRISRLGDSSKEALAGAGGASNSPVTLPAIGKPSVSESDTREEAAYQAAFSMIKDKRFDEAVVALKKLLKDYPKGQFSDNAQYWLGEVQMAQGKYKEAQDDFQSLIDRYPDSPKVSDATYKLGRILDLQGEKDAARKHLESVISQYPGSAAARLSDTYLRNMSDS